MTQVPALISRLAMINIKGIATGTGHSLAWDSEGKIYSWGDTKYGKLGHP